MDKNEYRVKTEHMLEYMDKKMYKQAMEIADTIDWRRVKNLSMLNTVSEIYECNGENQKSRDILFIAYDRSQGSRKIIYRLGTLAIKVNDLQEAMDCYEEFVALAPKDPNQYILKYKILKAQNAPIEQQIEALTDFKKVEYVEKWAYELAKLYNEAGLITECLEECDDLILWFSEGKYVLQAMQLKMQHKPLTPLQHEKYNNCIAAQNKVQFKKPAEEEKQTEPNVGETQKIDVDQVEKAQKQAADVPKEETEAPSQMKEETKEPQQTEKAPETPLQQESSTGSIIQTIVGATLEEALAKGVAAVKGVQLPDEDIKMEELKTEEAKEEPATAQEKIEGMLQNWEEKQKEVEQEIEIKRQQAEVEIEAKRKELEKQRTFHTMPIIPDDIQKLLEDLENGILDEEKEEEQEPEKEVRAERKISEEEEDYEVDDDFAVDEFADELEKEDSGADDDIITEEYEIPFPEIEEPEEVEEPEEPEEPQSALEQLEAEMEESQKSPGGVPFDTGFVVQGRYDLEAQSEIGLKAGLTEEQKKLFSYFVPVRGMSEQIVEVLENDKNCKTRYGTSRTGNILVVGRQGTGKTVLAVNIVKAIQKARKLKHGKVAIVTGEALNKKELSSIMSKLKGGALIIEKAGKMNSKTIRELNELMEEQTGEMLIVLEEQRRPVEKMLAANPDFKKKFTSKLELPIFINDELVTFGQTYAKENGYKIDEMGILALYSRIDVMQKEDHAVTVAEVKDIMDDAIERAQKANVKHFMKRVFGKRTDNSDRVILTEHDFK